MEFKIPFTNPLTGTSDSIKLTFNAARKNDPKSGDRATLGAAIDLPMNLVTIVPTILTQYYMMWKMTGGMDQALGQATKLHDSLTDILSDDASIEQVSDFLQTLDKDSIQTIMSRAINNTAEERLRTATIRIALANMFNEEQSIAASRGIHNTLPKRTRNLFDSTRPAGKTLADQVRARKSMLQNTTPQKLADIIREETAYIPVETIAASAYEMTQKMTPDAVKAFLTHLTNNLSEDDLKTVVVNGFDTVDSVLDATSKGNFTETGLEDGLNEIRQHVENLLQVIEDSFIAAEITPDTDLIEPLKNWAEMQELVRQKSENKGPGNANKGPAI